MKDAIIFKRNKPLDVADAIVDKLKYRTDEEGWMCHVVPVDSASICFSFGDGKTRYEAIISKINQSRNLQD